MLNWIVLFLFIILIISISYIIFKKILKIIISLIIILIILAIILSCLLYSDINSLKTNIPTSNNLILLEDNEKLLTGIAINLEQEKFTPLSEQELNSINPKNNQYYKTLLINMPFIEKNIKTEYRYNGITLTKQQIITILKSENPIENIKTISNNPNPEINGYKSQIKANILPLIFNKDIKFNQLLIEYKESNLKIYPKTVTFYMVDFIPTAILKNIQ